MHYILLLTEEVFLMYTSVPKHWLFHCCTVHVEQAAFKTCFIFSSHYKLCFNEEEQQLCWISELAVTVFLFSFRWMTREVFLLQHRSLLHVLLCLYLQQRTARTTTSRSSRWWRRRRLTSSWRRRWRVCWRRPTWRRWPWNRSVRG